jgi:hypothetical protein
MHKANPHPNIETLKAYGMGQVEGAAAATILLQTPMESRHVVTTLDVCVAAFGGLLGVCGRDPIRQGG